MLGHAAAATGSKIWIFGGQQGRKFLRSLYCFNTETCTWTRRDHDSHPAARAGHSMVTVHGSVVYLFGGQGKRLYNDLYKLDAQTGTFTEVEASGKPPTPRRGQSMVWDGRDYLVCFGGINASSTDAQLSVFSLSRGAWFTPQAFGPAPSARTQHTAQLLSPGVILIFGGCNSAGTFFNDAVVLDTRSFTWQKPTLLNTAPAPRYHHTCAMVNGRIIIYGGINSKQTFDGVVVLETKFMSDISSVAEELFRMSADAGTASLLGLQQHSPQQQTQGTMQQQQHHHHLPLEVLPPGAGSVTAAAGGGGCVATPVSVMASCPSSAAPMTRLVSASSAQLGGPSSTVLPPGPQVVPGPGSSALGELTGGFSSSKSLEAVKIQLTDLLLRRNLEEQQLHAARKAETTESLLAKEREAREATVKEMLQYKLLLAEAEAAQASVQQELQAALTKANREAAAAAELRSQVEALQTKLAAREEELQEARLLQDGLVKELGIMASRYSRLATDVQEGGGERTTRDSAPSATASASADRDRGGPAQQHPRSTTVSPPFSTSAGRTSLGTMLSGRASGPSAGGAAAGRTASSHAQAHSLADELPTTSESHSVPLPERSASSLTSLQPGVMQAPALSAHCTTSLRTSASASSCLAHPAPACGSCCQQLLSLLSDSEVHRSALLEAHQSLSDKVEELAAQNNLLYGQLQQMHADAGALEPLPLAELEELERKLDGAVRGVRDALLRRKIDEAQRRSSSEQAACAVCMEGPKAVVFNCGHQSCEVCSGRLNTCPFCRVSITARIRLFDA